MRADVDGNGRNEDHHHRVDVVAGGQPADRGGQLVGLDRDAEVQRAVVDHGQPGIQAGIQREHTERGRIADDRDPVAARHGSGRPAAGRRRMHSARLSVRITPDCANRVATAAAEIERGARRPTPG